MNRAPAEYKFIMNVFRRLMRERRMKFRDLASKVKMSESGLKKIFAAEDGSLGRLNQIARALEINLADVISESAEEDSRTFAFTSEQQELFDKNPQAFQLYFKLVIERYSLNEIRSWQKLSESELFKLLRKLDQARLIKLMSENKIRVPSLAMIRSFGGGPFLTQAYQRWGQQLVKELARPDRQGEGHFILRCLRMKDATYHEFLARLQELESEFLRRAVREMSLSLGHTKTMRWISMSDQKSFID